ncbi:MAG: serine hydrolase, partial [Mameliella sp.]|nr:serine hydrolase [Phaeodactylibacter sp.]
MKNLGLVLVLIWALAVSCQREEALPNIDLPGLSPFLQTDDTAIKTWLADKSPEEKLQHLLMLKSGGEALSNASLGSNSGSLLTSVKADDLERIDQLWKVRSNLPPLKLISPNQLPVALFGESQQMPSLTALSAIGEDTLRNRLKEAYLGPAMALGLSGLSIPGYGVEGGATLQPESEMNNQARWINRMNGLNLLSIAAPFSDPDLLEGDSTKAYINALSYHRTLIEAGLSAFWLENRTWPVSSRVAKLFREELQFGGLLIAEVTTDAEIIDWLEADADLLVIAQDQYTSILTALKSVYRKGLLTEAWLDQKLTKILKARSWAGQESSPAISKTNNYPAIEASVGGAVATPPKPKLTREAYFQSENWEYWQRKSFAASIVLAANPDSKVPLAAGGPSWTTLHLPGTVYNRSFEKILGRYADYKVARSWAEAATADQLIVLLDDYLLKSSDLGQLNRMRRQSDVVIVNLGHPTNLQYLNRREVVVQAFGNSDLEKALSAQVLFGGIKAKGRLPLTYSPDFLMGQGEKTEQVRLAYGVPQQVGIQPQRLVGIDAIVQSAIDEEATPGAQVLVAKKGKVIYHKAFGHHTYEKENRVLLSDLYDVASITKIAATTLVAMQQYEEEHFEAKDKLKEHLDLPGNSRLKNLTIQKLMTHRSGLQPHLPVIPYLLAREADNDNCAEYFCKTPSDEFPIPVADSFFFSSAYHDQIWDDMQRLRGRRTRYRYSDANFVLAQRMLEQNGGKGLDTLAAQWFYEPLGLRHTCFKPLNSFPLQQIMPTEDDYRWRHQLVHGFVHDETAALLGGVAGHAGLFSTAQDLAVLAQMLLN